jgi:hypothetical protein
MKKSFNNIIIGIFIFITITTKAQEMDTAFVQNLYSSQYIYPNLVDTNYASVNVLSYAVECQIRPFSLTVAPDNNVQKFVRGFSQHYEVKDSVKIMGTALMILPDIHINNSNGKGVAEISIWDTTMTTMIYSKRFIEGGYASNYQAPSTSYYPYVEFIFDTTLTLYEDYNVAVDFLRINGLSYDPLFMALSDYIDSSFNPWSEYCIPYGICTKYKPYIRLIGNSSTEWKHVDSVTHWMDFTRSYTCVARYQSYQLTMDYPDMPTCDTAVYKAIGLCPIRALEDTLSDGNDTILNGGDSTNSALQLSKQLDDAVRLSPIPADEILNIKSDYNILSIEVFDAMNRFIERKESNSKSLQLNIGKYQAGTYFIRIKTDKGLVKKKFIVG